MSEVAKKKRIPAPPAKKRQVTAPARHVPFPEEDNGAPKPPAQTGSYSIDRKSVV